MAWMENDGNYDRLMLNDPETGITIPKNIFILGGVGSGKSMCAEQICDYYHRNGYTILILNDEKGELETAFTAFEPIEPYHNALLRKFGCPKQAKPTKIYHPFTFDLPHKKIPNIINIYTFNIKELDRTDLQFMGESIENKRSYQIILQTLEKLHNYQGLHHLVFFAENQTESQTDLSLKKVKIRSDDSDLFFSKVKQATDKTATEIISYFKSFLRNYTLTPANCQLNLDYKQIMNDQKNYHIFTTKWIKDRRDRTFYTLHLLNQFIKHSDNAKHPILFYIQEIRYLTPNKSDGFSSYMAELMKDTLTTMRNKGKGYASVLDSQSLRDTSEKVISSCNERLIGKISSIQELESIDKALRLNKQDFSTLQSVDRGEFFIEIQDPLTESVSYQKFKLWIPPHMHKEVGYNFFDIYESIYPDKMQDTQPIIKQMNALKTRIETEVQMLKDQENETKKSQITKAKEQETKTNTTQELRQTITKNKEEKTELKTQIKTMILKYYDENPDKSYSQIAEAFNMRLSNGKPDKVKVMRIIKERQADETISNKDQAPNQ